MFRGIHRGRLGRLQDVFVRPVDLVTLVETFDESHFDLVILTDGSGNLQGSVRDVSGVMSPEGRLVVITDIDSESVEETLAVASSELKFDRSLVRFRADQGIVLQHKLGVLVGRRI